MTRTPGITDVARVAAALAGRRLRFTGAVVLAYHDVQPAEQLVTDYTVTPEVLRAQLLRTRRTGLTFVTLDEIVSRWLANTPVDGLAAVVFDDALLGVHCYAAQILEDLAVPATLYPLTQGLGARPSWWPGSARTLTAAELAELRDLGWTVGSHTRTHRSLPRLGDQALRDEVAGSKAELEDAVGHRISTIAYPFGHHDPRVRAVCREAGYQVGFTFLNGRIDADLDPFRLPRFTMSMHWQGPRWAYALARGAGSWPDTQVDHVLGAPDD